jgi:hypothetical protein
MKPIAWMSPDGKFSTTEGKLFYIPLYTAPRELSDEEIDMLAFEYNCIDDFPHEFVRACIKKASEK